MMKKYYKWLLVCVLGFGAGVQVVSVHAKSRLEERLSRLFFWQMSQALDLSTSEEKQMTQILQGLHQRRLDILDRRQQLHEQMSKIAKSSQPQKDLSTKLMMEYRDQIELLAKIDVEEHEQLLKVLGSEKLLKFYNERKAIVEQIKSALVESKSAAN